MENSERALPRPELGLTPKEAELRFEQLQRRLIPLWKSIRTLNQDPQTIVVVPSISVDVDFPGSVMQAYEERFLFLLLLLRQPNARLVYATSQAIHPSTLDYYLSLLVGVIPSHARRRLFLVAPLDGSSRPLTLKLLERPQLIARMRELISDPERAHLVPFSTTWLERDLALRLGIPMYGADPRFFELGTKSGSRRLFAEEGVPHPAGFENLRTLDDARHALARLRAARPQLARAIVKLNEGVSGEGNAVVELAGLPPPGDHGEDVALAARLKAMRFESAAATLESYTAKLQERGGAVEEFVSGETFRSPSVQLRVTPLGQLELLSTHDQLLGGPSGQSFLGCRFPADPAYAALISREALKVGARLAKEGVLGRFAIDFVAVRATSGAWDVYAIEINLRKGGTTHPFLTLQFLTDGSYDAERAVFTAPGGQTKCFVASDHVESPSYRAFTPDDLFDLAVRHGLHFDQARQTGVVFHMLSAIAERGRFGLTAVADSAEEADALYRRALAIVDEEAERALLSPPLA